MSEIWHCHAEPGQTYEDLVQLHGQRRMLFAVLHLPEPTRSDIEEFFRTERAKLPWWKRWFAP